MLNSKGNAVEITKWRWKPKQWELPALYPVRFLEQYGDTSIVGLSIYGALSHMGNGTEPGARSQELAGGAPTYSLRNISFVLKEALIENSEIGDPVLVFRWSADASGRLLESLGYKDGCRVDVDVADSTWAEAPSFCDVIILNTGHWWWAPPKFDPVTSPMFFFKKGVPVLPPVTPDVGLDMVLNNMMLFVESRMQPAVVKVFHTHSPRHFEEVIGTKMALANMGPLPSNLRGCKPPMCVFQELGNRGSITSGMQCTGLAELPVKYLGVPLSLTGTSVMQFRALIQRVTARVISWREKLLYYGGRVQLIESVLQSTSVENSYPHNNLKTHGFRTGAFKGQNSSEILTQPRKFSVVKRKMKIVHISFCSVECQAVPWEDWLAALPRRIEGIKEAAIVSENRKLGCFFGESGVVAFDL
ncbi:hypothetical protein Ancab_023054 [Ancistrocladus abbreviatus]